MLVSILPDVLAGERRGTGHLRALFCLTSGERSSTEDDSLLSSLPFSSLSSSSKSVGTISGELVRPLLLLGRRFPRVLE
uniref:Uncharacterized protein n=1 Tax=Arundo donax TaxID=35708 RepID=A0A0A9CSU9_ARUDO